MRWIEEKALALGGRPHWGQQNHLTATQVERLYGDRLTRWRTQLGRITGEKSTFSHHHSIQRGLEPFRPRLENASWLHGNRLQIEYPERLVRVSRTAAYIQLEGTPGTENWFHFAIPTPVIVHDQRLKAGSVMLRYRTTGATVVHAVHVYDGERKIADYNGLALHPAEWVFERHDVPGTPDIRWGLGISIGVRFPASGRLDVAAAGCDFITLQ